MIFRDRFDKVVNYVLENKNIQESVLDVLNERIQRLLSHHVDNDLLFNRHIKGQISPIIFQVFQFQKVYLIDNSFKNQLKKLPQTIYIFIFK